MLSAITTSVQNSYSSSELALWQQFNQVLKQYDQALGSGNKEQIIAAMVSLDSFLQANQSALISAGNANGYGNASPNPAELCAQLNAECQKVLLSYDENPSAPLNSWDTSYIEGISASLLHMLTAPS